MALVMARLEAALAAESLKVQAAEAERNAERERAEAAAAERRVHQDRADALRAELLEAERLRGRIFKGLSAFQAEFERQLSEYKSQRAWRIMLAIRKAYTFCYGGIRLGPSPAIWIDLS